MIHRRYDDIILTICDTREEMGRQAAAEAADCAAGGFPITGINRPITPPY